MHRVTLTKGFFLGVHPVTQAQLDAVMDYDESHFKGANRPVEQVSSSRAYDLCYRLGTSQEPRLEVRLPSEAEWEWACRAGTTTEYFFGNEINTGLANYDGSPNGEYREMTTVVGSFPCNAWGLFDLHGNVWEWCEDEWDEHFYQHSPTHDPMCEVGGRRVLRGGSWLDYPVDCRSSCRNSAWRHSEDDSYGCRVCFRLD